MKLETSIRAGALLVAMLAVAAEVAAETTCGNTACTGRITEMRVYNDSNTHYARVILEDGENPSFCNLWSGGWSLPRGDDNMLMGLWAAFQAGRIVRLRVESHPDDLCTIQYILIR